MKPRTIHQMLPSEVFSKAHQVAVAARANTEGDYCEIFGRYWIHRHWFTEFLHTEYALPWAKKIWGEGIRPSYSGLSLYVPPFAVCPPHHDRDQCKMSLDLCLEKSENWPLVVDGLPYILQENEALAYSGTDDYHWRSPATPEQSKLTMAFFHFVPADFKGELD